MKEVKRRRVKSRGVSGAALAEFAPALLVLFFLLIPLIDLVIAPIRCLVAAELLVDLTRKLALSKKWSEAVSLSEADRWHQQFADKWGIKLKEPKLALICSNEFQSVTIPNGQAIPPAWLPNGANAPCDYLLQMSMDAEISLLDLGRVGFVDLREPIRLTLRANSHWENLGRDPDTNGFYINE